MTQRVLIVDDDSMSREVIALLLEHESYTVLTAASGDAALALLRNDHEPPAFILTDMQMPGISGNELALELRRACGPSALLLAMSGSEASQDAISHFDGFLLKPFAMGEMTARLSAAAKIANSIRSTPLAPSASNQEMSRAEQHPPIPATPIEAKFALPLDETIFSQLTTAMPKPQLLQMYSMCLDDARDRIASMRASAAAGDAIQFIRQAHALKGGSGMLGATELYNLASALERSGPPSFGQSAQQGQQTVNPLDELESACVRLERILTSRALTSST